MIKRLATRTASALIVAFALLAGLPALSQVKAAPPEPVTVCHRPATPAQQTLTLPAPAAERQIANGDIQGPCSDVWWWG